MKTVKELKDILSKLPDENLEVLVWIDEVVYNIDEIEEVSTDAGKQKNLFIMASKV